jgi:hypothetical protein
MTPFLQFRLWLRRGPRAERLAAGTAAVLLFALLAWAAIPLRDPQSVVAGAPAAVAGEPATAGTASGSGLGAGPGSAGMGAMPATTGQAATGTTATVPAPAGAGVAGSTGATPAAVGAAGTAGRCDGLRASDQGVTPTELFVAMPIINLVGAVGNETFNLRSADELAAAAQAIVAEINERGGVACRKLRIKTYKVNMLDQNEQRARCLEIVRDKPFAVIDYAGFAGASARACIIQAKIPYEATAGGGLSEADLAREAPYVYHLPSSIDRKGRMWAFESAARGAFDPKRGFRKLGVLLTECNPPANASLKQSLRQVGLRDDQLSVFTLSGCGVNSPSEISQALLQHRNAGVSHVFLGATTGNDPTYVRQADAVSWKPVYLTSDFGNETGVAPGNWPDGFDGTIAITSLRIGEHASGSVAPWWTRCNEWLKKRRVRPAEGEADRGVVQICDIFRLFVAVANAAGPNPVRSTFTQNVARVGRFESATQLDANFDRPGKVTGGDHTRAIQWRRSCKCWSLLDRQIKPAHP